MKARRLSEMRQLASSQELRAWWEALLEARRAHEEARERSEELLSQAMLMDFRAELAQKNAIDTLYRAGELEDSAAKLAAEAQALENTSFKAVADFEEQRFRASESWYRQCALERRVESHREELDSARQALAAAPVRREAAEAEVKRIETEFKRAERALAQAVQEYEREESAKRRLWEEVERDWSRSMELSLLIAEQRVRGRKVRAEAERLFGQADDRKGRAAKLRAEADAAAREREAAEARIGEQVAQACERFGAGRGEDFLYFRQKENPRRAWCLALLEDGQSYNIEVQPLGVYSVEQKRGVQFLEPAVEATGSAEEGDRRFEEYFLKGRKGRVRGDDERQSA